MKKVIAIWFAVSLTLYIVFGLSLDARSYMMRFTNLQSPLVIFNDVITAFRQLVDSFNGISGFGDVLKAIMAIFNLLINVVMIPVEIIGYLIDIVMIILPIGLGV